MLLIHFQPRLELLTTFLRTDLLIIVIHARPGPAALEKLPRSSGAADRAFRRTTYFVTRTLNLCDEFRMKKGSACKLKLR